MKILTSWVFLFLLNEYKTVYSNDTVPIFLLPFRFLAQQEHLINNNDESSNAKYVSENETNILVGNEEIVINSNASGNLQQPMVNIVERRQKRRAVKLTMKQGLLMNQILGVYALENVQNELCKNHTREFKNDLRAFEPWALKMFDSSSKLQSGVLLGNLIDLGSFTQCLKIYKHTVYGAIHGKYCLIKIKPSIELIQKILSIGNISETRFKKIYNTVEYSEIGWSVCVPHSCPKEDILRHFNKTILEVAEGLALSVYLDGNYCSTSFDVPVMTNANYIVLLFFGTFIILGLIIGSIDMYSLRDSNSTFIDIFSTYKNLQRVMKKDSGRQDLNFIHGLKFLSSCSVVMGHRYLMCIMFPVINRVEELDWIMKFSSMIILGSTVSVDSFFMTSGMLVSIGFFEYVTKTGSFNIALFYLHRYLRITLPLGLVILFYVTLAQFLQYGPITYDVYFNHQKPCQDYWWSAILHIQAFVNPSHLCIYPVWYLSSEMPFYFLSPLILYPLWKWPKFGYINIFFLFILATISSFYFAWIHMYNGEPLPVTGLLLSNEYFTTYYIQPHIRAAPYILGLAFGYIIFRKKCSNIRIKKWVNVILWIISSVMMGLAYFGCYSFYLDSHEYNRLESSIYLTFSRSAWTLGLMWVMWSCMHGYGGIVNDFLSAYAFRVLGRITYGIFLLHSIIQLYKIGSSKVPSYFSDINTVFDGFADLVCASLVSFIFTVFYELPLIRLEILIFKQGRRKVNPTKQITSETSYKN